MTALTTHILGNSGTTRNRLFAPFTVYARFLQDDFNTMSGNRWEKWRAEQHVANLIEMSLRTFVEQGESSTDSNDDYQLFVSFPIAFTRQFGQQPARITISGSYRGSSKEIDTSGIEPHFPPKKTAADVVQINANEVRTGQGSFNTANLDPNDTVRQFAVQIRDLFSDQSKIEFIDRVEVIAVDVFGIKYGRGGRHFSPS